MVDENTTPTPEEPVAEPEVPAADLPTTEVIDIEEPVAALEPEPIPEPPAAPEPIVPPVPEPVVPPVPPAPPAAPTGQYMPPPAPAPVAGAAEKSKVVAGVLGILLGSLGVHKFYLGYTKEGVIMLAVSLVSFGMLAWAMSILGLIEGIMYLVKTDEEFYATYVAGRKPWL